MFRPWLSNELHNKMASLSRSPMGPRNHVQMQPKD